MEIMYSIKKIEFTFPAGESQMCGIKQDFTASKIQYFDIDFTLNSFLKVPNGVEEATKRRTITTLASSGKLMHAVESTIIAAKGS